MSILNIIFVQLQNNLWSTSTGRIKRALSPAPSPPASPDHQSASTSSFNGDHFDTFTHEDDSFNGKVKKSSRRKNKMAKRESLETYSDDEEEDIFTNGKLKMKTPQEVWLYGSLFDDASKDIHK